MLAVRAEFSAERQFGLRQRRQSPAARDLPQRCVGRRRVCHPERQQSMPIGTEHRRPYRACGVTKLAGDGLASRRVPEPGRSVFGCAGYHLSVGSECDVPDVSAVPERWEQHLAGHGVQHRGLTDVGWGRRPACQCESLAVRAELTFPRITSVYRPGPTRCGAQLPDANHTIAVCR